MSKASEEEFIHGCNMVEHYGLSLESIKAAKRTCWGANTEMQIFAIGYEAGKNASVLPGQSREEILREAVNLLRSSEAQFLFNAYSSQGDHWSVPLDIANYLEKHFQLAGKL